MMYRHGDLLIKQVEQIPGGSTKEHRAGDIILAEGEATGHAHRVKELRAQTLTAPDGVRYLVIENPDGATLQHEEHKAVHLPQGNYLVIRQHVYVPREAPRVVAD